MSDNTDQVVTSAAADVRPVPQPSVCVVIPVYQKQFSKDEAESLTQCMAVLRPRHDVAFVCSDDFDTSVIPAEYLRLSKIERFPHEFFVSRRAYSSLCASPDFYKRFMGYTHILIYQLDGYVFRDDLLERWVKYDYVGAPWCFGCRSCGAGDIAGRVGNGGVSLRNVKKCYDVVSRYTGDPSPEDMNVFGTDRNAFAGVLRRPGCHEALEFSMETGSAVAGFRSTGVVPSFCHALVRRDRPLFVELKAMIAKRASNERVADGAHACSASDTKCPPNYGSRELWERFDFRAVSHYSGHMARKGPLDTEFQRVGLSGVMEFWSAPDPFINVLYRTLPLSSCCARDPRHIAIAIKHQQMIRTAYDTGAMFGLFMADDIVFLRDVSLLNESIGHIPDDADVLLFEWLAPWGPQEFYDKIRAPSSGSFWRKFGRVGVLNCGCYALSRKAMAAMLRILEAPADGKTLFDVCDRHWAELSDESGLNMYVSAPVACIQDEAKHQHAYNDVDARRELYGA